MTLTILFDLDDTLLDNDIDKFLPAYLRELSGHMDGVPSSVFIDQLLFATQNMVKKKGPQKFLEEVFDENFYPGLDVTKREWQKPLDEFYKNKFPELKYLTKPRPEAVRAIEYAFNCGHQVIIATNPLFPKIAIQHRLDWANLSSNKFPFALITSFENFHFSKPNPAYFLEILAQLGWPEQPVLYIGNDFNEEILPAVELGFPFYWVTNNGKQLPADAAPGSTSGPISGVISWMEKMEGMALPYYPRNPKALIHALSVTPAALETLSKELPGYVMAMRPRPEDWSLTEILCHLRDVDLEINLPRMKNICLDENPFLPGIASDIWAEERKYSLQDGGKALRDFMNIRSSLVDQLAALLPGGWECPARHSIFGPTHVAELVSFIFTHDQNHIRQARDAVKTALARST